MGEVLLERGINTGVVLQLVQGDITQESVDAIVNAANNRLKHGGGVAGAIVRKGGPEIQVESDAWVRKYGLVSHDSPAYTSAGKLPCRYVIHAVGPMWGDGGEEAKLRSAILGSLKVADRLRLASIAMPAISTGVFGFPKDLAARVLFQAIETYFSQNRETGIKQVRLTLFDKDTLDVFSREWKNRFGEKA